MIYVVPDTHLGHENIKKYCNRPDNFERLIEKNWNETITENDTVIHLGDISFNQSFKIVWAIAIFFYILVSKMSIGYYINHFSTLL